MLTIRWLAAWLVVTVASSAVQGQAPAGRKDPARYEKEIQAYEAVDRTAAPPKGAILFIGSSTIRLWKTLAEDFPEHAVINRGFGGAHIADCAAFVDRIVAPYAPSMIFFRCGGNDLNAGLSPEQVFNDFRTFANRVRAKVPDVEIVYISLCPNIAREKQTESNKQLNNLVEAYIRRTPRMKYIETFDMAYDANRKLRPELFAKDKLHFSPEGYKELVKYVKPYFPEVPPAGQVRLDQAVSSSILKKPMRYSVYLPPGYETTTQSYPVLYLLHGRTDDHTSWLKKGNAQAIIDRQLAAGQAEPMIVVMPDGELTYYMNNIRGEYQYEDYFVKELIPHIEKTYRCKSEKKYRSIAGLSMGGFGSLLYSLHHPELFQSCYAMSAGVWTAEDIERMPLKEFLNRFKTPLGEFKEGDPRTSEFWRQNSILDLVPRVAPANKKAVRFFIDCGDDDFLYRGNSLLHITMRDAGIPHEFRVRDGGHNWEYWKRSLPEAMNFVSQGLK